MSIYRLSSAVTRNSISALTCFALAVLGAGTALAAPCPTATVDVYVALGATGCQIGALTFSQFKYIPFGNTLLPATDVLITPTIDANGTGIAISSLGAPPWFALFFGRTDIELQYIAKSTNPLNTFTSLYTELNGTFTGAGFDQVVELFCPGGTTLPPDQTCPGIPPGVKSVIVTIPGGPNFNRAPLTFPFAVNSIAVLKDMDANALQGGSATITSVKNQLNVACQCI